MGSGRPATASGDNISRYIREIRTYPMLSAEEEQELCLDPDHGVRFATYAVRWVRAAIQAYILHNWSLVKIGSTSSQRKLFFNVRRIRGELQEFEDGTLKSEHVSAIATKLMVPEHEIITMNQRLAGRDGSLNAPVDADSPGGKRDCWTIPMIRKLQ